MKKRIEELTQRDAIHCPTKEQWEQILKLNPKNDCEVESWYADKENTCYKPNGDIGRGDFHSLDYCKSKGYTIHKAEDFLGDTGVSSNYCQRTDVGATDLETKVNKKIKKLKKSIAKKKRQLEFLESLLK